MAADKASEEKNLRLVSQEGESYEVTIEVAKMSELVKTMIDGMNFFYIYNLKLMKEFFNFLITYFFRRARRRRGSRNSSTERKIPNFSESYCVSGPSQNRTYARN